MSQFSYLKPFKTKKLSLNNLKSYLKTIFNLEVKEKSQLKSYTLNNHLKHPKKQELKLKI